MGINGNWIVESRASEKTAWHVVEIIQAALNVKLEEIQSQKNQNRPKA